MKSIWTMGTLVALVATSAWADCQQTQQEWAAKPRFEAMNIAKNDDLSYLTPAFTRSKMATLARELSDWTHTDFNLNLYSIVHRNLTERCRGAKGVVALKYAKFEFTNTDSREIGPEFKACRTDQVTALAGLFSDTDRLVELTVLGVEPTLQMFNAAEDYTLAYPAAKETFKIPYGVTLKKGTAPNPGMLVLSAYMTRNPQSGALECVTVPLEEVKRRLDQAMGAFIASGDPGVAERVLALKAQFRAEQSAQPSKK